MADKNTIKNWFRTGLKPSQAQFWATWDSFWHKDEKIPITAIDDIEAILAEKADAEVVAHHLNDVTAHADFFLGKEDKFKKGAASGYVPLNEFVKIASEYLNIVNDLFTGGATALLSAEQGVVLQTQIENINALLASDNVNLDNVQELVDAIETVKMSLDAILVNDLTTGGTTKALTAEMGKTLKGLIDNLQVITNSLNSYKYTVKGNGTNIENAAELQAMYNFAKTQSPSATNILTVIIAPGNYNFGATQFLLDTQFINVVSLDGYQSVIFNSSNGTGTINVNIGNVFVKGINVLSKSFITGNFATMVIENCKGGIDSFGGIGVASGTFTNCTGGERAFGGIGMASGTFTNCTGGYASFGGIGMAPGTFTNCTGGYASFGGNGTASGTFTNCTGGERAFGGNGSLTGKLYYCRLTVGTFTTVSNGGRTVMCIDGLNGINNQPSLVKTISTSNYFQNATLVPTVIEGMTAIIMEPGKYKVEYNGQYNTTLANITQQSVVDLNALYLNLNGQPVTNINFPTFTAGSKILPGVYETSEAVGPVGSITLDGQGNSNAVFIFRTVAAFSTGAGCVFNLTNGASARNVFVIAGGVITLGAGSNIAGTLISPLAACGVGAGAFLNGRIFSMAAAVSTMGNINVPIGTSQFNMGILPNFAMFTSIGAATNVGSSIIVGDIGTNNGTVTGFQDATLSGFIYLPNQGASFCQLSIYVDGVIVPTSARERSNAIAKEDIVLSDFVTITSGQTISIKVLNSIGISRFYNRNLTITKI